MKTCNYYLRFANGTALSCLLAVTAFLAGSWQVRAQAASSTSRNQASPSGSLATLAGHTPPQVLKGEVTKIGTYDPTKKLRLVIGLQHPDLAGEEKLLKELQTKGSSNFQKFLTPEEWNTRFSPSAADEQAVVDWATSQGFTVTQRYPNRLLVDVSATVGTIETALGVTISTYQVGDRVAFSNDQDPVIPSSLVNTIHSMGGLNSIQVLRPNNKGLGEPVFADYSDGPVSSANPAVGVDATAKRPSSAGGPGANITDGAYDPTDIYSSQAYDVNALYNQGHCCNPLNNSGVTPPSSSIAIATAGTQDGSDFSGFHTQYPYLAEHWQQYYIDGTPTCCDGEGTEDFDWSTAWSNSFGSYVDTAMINLYDGVNANFSTFTDVYNAIYTGGKAKIFTTSWGCEEVACTPTSVMDTDHGIFNSMVGTGMTLMAASGDQGATAGCGDAVAVQYPASDPDIVGAGGTTLSLNSSSVFLSEVAWSGGPDGCGSNDGGSTGGESAYYAKPSYQSSISGLGSNRYVPDIALNADWYYTPENIYYGGGLQGNGGTSIVAPSLAGFFAQTNAYLDYVATINGGCYGVSTCSPIGNGNYYLYWFGENQTYAPHYPFYDITSGCNNNDETTYWGLGYYCTATGYDPVTGWGSINALQLARAITTYRAYYGTTTATFTGPTVNKWYNTDQEVSWTVTGAGQDGYASTGVAGYTQAWDTYIYDSVSASRPATSDSFFAGVEYPNSTTGYLYVSWAGQGCHTAQVRSWDNSGGGGYQTYGPVCYDTVVPTITASDNPAAGATSYADTSVVVTLTATDPGGTAASGIYKTYYSINSGACTPSALGSCSVYSSPFTISTQGKNFVYYFTEDNAGNFSTRNSILAYIDETAPVATASLSGTLTSGKYYSDVNVTLAATDNLSGVAHIYYELDGGSQVTYSAPFTVTVVGSHTVKYWAVDVAGNVETTLTTNFTIGGIATTMSSPAAGSTLTGISVTFTWPAATGATLYNLSVGSTGVGSSNVYISGWRNVTSWTANPLPTNGETLYVRLSTDFNGVVEYNDYTYKATTQAAITSPAATTTLTGPSVAFTWSSATGANLYYLSVGSTGVGSSNIYNSGWRDVLSWTATGLPTNGNTLYVRISTDYNGQVVHTDSTYTAATAAVLTTPTPSTTLSGSSVTFDWAAGTTGSTDYYLSIGSTGVGSSNIYASGWRNELSQAVTGLPTNGETLYVRLSTNFGGTAVYNDYTYKAF